jgi:predicted nucleic acid-binding protein
MEKIVVDSSVAIKWFVVEPYTDASRMILDEYGKGVLTLHAPDLINAEIGNVVWKKHAFQGLDEADAQSIIDVFLSLGLVLTPTVSLLRSAYHIAVSSGRTVYDALYVALSVREECQFVTADEKLANALKPKYENVVWIGNWPIWRKGS